MYLYYYVFIAHMWFVMLCALWTFSDRVSYAVCKNSPLFFSVLNFFLAGFKHHSLSSWIWAKQNDLLSLLVVFACKARDICKESMNLFYKKTLLLLWAKTFLCKHREIAPGASHSCVSRRQFAICWWKHFAASKMSLLSGAAASVFTICSVK